MRNVADVRERWRHQAARRALSLRLMMVGFPVSLAQAIAGADSADPSLIKWARDGLQGERVFRSAQAERLAQGLSLEAIASMTGVPVFDPNPRPGDPTSCVLAILAWPGPPLEEEE